MITSAVKLFPNGSFAYRLSYIHFILLQVSRRQQDGSFPDRVVFKDSSVFLFLLSNIFDLYTHIFVLFCFLSCIIKVKCIQAFLYALRVFIVSWRISFTSTFLLLLEEIFIPIFALEWGGRSDF